MVLSEGALADFDINFFGSTTAGHYNATLSFTTDQNAAFGAAGDVFDFGLSATVAEPPPVVIGDPVLLDGQRVEISYRYPDDQTVYSRTSGGTTYGPYVWTTTVGDGIEFPIFPELEPTPPSSVDFSEGQITITAIRDFIPGGGGAISFNGYVITDYADEMAEFVNFELLENTTNTDDAIILDAIYFDENNLYINLIGIDFTNGDSIVIGLNTVPEPNSMVLLVPASLMLLRRRRAACA